MNPHKIPEWFQRELTFYHEIQIPQNPFFDKVLNREDGTSLLVVSSPSRMGNHLLMSSLDDHPELPRVPGEDGFLMFSFVHAQHDLGRFRSRLAAADAPEFCMRMAANSSESKWRRYNQLTSGVKAGEDPVNKISGIGSAAESAVQDFEGFVIPINFSCYEKHLLQHREKIQGAETFKDVFHVYLEALSRLDPKADERGTLKFDRYLVHGAMRTQLRWLCATHRNFKILCSVRSFPSYAVSQIRSRHGEVPFTDKLLREAWEHWFHKVVDAAWLAVKYPSQFGLVTYDDLVFRPAQIHSAICRFLGIRESSSASRATIFGEPVRGNSWNTRTDEMAGQFYTPKALLSEELIPERAHALWGAIETLKLNCGS